MENFDIEMNVSSTRQSSTRAKTPPRPARSSSILGMAKSVGIGVLNSPRRAMSAVADMWGDVLDDADIGGWIDGDDTPGPSTLDKKTQEKLEALREESKRRLFEKFLEEKRQQVEAMRLQDDSATPADAGPSDEAGTKDDAAPSDEHKADTTSEKQVRCKPRSAPAPSTADAGW